MESTEHKQNLFKSIIEKRTRHLSVLIEDLYQPHNASAVLRSCDCFGVQDVHIIENKNKYTINPEIALGASKWLSIYKYNQEENNTVTAINTLKSKGYKVFATTPHTNDSTISELPVEDKTVLLFGTEAEGVSQLAMDHADGFCVIPMYGFTESFNISVSAALCLRDFTERLRQSKVDWKLTALEKEDLLLEWIKQVAKSGEDIEQVIRKELGML